jgi:hypothetical protein
MAHLSTRLIALGLATATLAACNVDDTEVAVSQMPSMEEQACLAAVSRESQNGDVVLLGSEFSQAGTFVRVGVGPNRAPWKCIAYSDGTTAGVEFMGSEGAA